MKKNKSLTYLLPLLFKENSISHAFEKYVKNTYLELPELWFEYILILEVNKSKYKDDKLLAKFIEILYLCKGFDSAFEASNGNEIFIMTLHVHRNEWNQFNKGKYSRYTSSAKSCIVKFWTTLFGDIKFTRDVTDTLYQNNRLKNELEQKLGVTLPSDAELSSIFNPQNEIFKND